MSSISHMTGSTSLMSAAQTMGWSGICRIILVVWYSVNKLKKRVNIDRPLRIKPLLALYSVLRFLQNDIRVSVQWYWYAALLSSVKLNSHSSCTASLMAKWLETLREAKHYVTTNYRYTPKRGEKQMWARNTLLRTVNMHFYLCILFYFSLTTC